MLKHILPLIPKHKIYVEPFFGGGAVFWAKTPSEVEIINDFNSNVVIFYEQLKNDPCRIKKMIDTTPYARDPYKYAITIIECPHLFTPIARAWAFWMATTQGFSNKIGSWRCAQNTSKEINTFNSKKSIEIDVYSDRLQKTQIENKDAIDLIARHDSKETFFYLDPPYVNSNQGHYGGYMQEHFDALLDALSKLGYESQLFVLNSATMGVAQSRERVFIISRRNDLQLSPLKLEFNNPLIPFKHVMEKNPIVPPKKLWPSIEARLPYVEWGDQNLKFADAKFRNKTTFNAFFSTNLLYSHEVPGTLTSSGTSICYDEMRGLDPQELVRMSSFPSDFNFNGMDERYVCGMSVPPLMIARIAEAMKLQWFLNGI